MGRWVRVAAAAELTADGGRAIEADGRRLALFRDAGEFFAIDDTCPHQGASLSKGTFHAGRVICPLHAWVFDIRTGHCPRDTHEPVAAYPTRLRDDSVEVELPD